jgi:hypothetical protein
MPEDVEVKIDLEDVAGGGVSVFDMWCSFTSGGDT